MTTRTHEQVANDLVLAGFDLGLRFAFDGLLSNVAVSPDGDDHIDEQKIDEAAIHTMAVKYLESIASGEMTPFESGEFDGPARQKLQPHYRNAAKLALESLSRRSVA